METADQVETEHTISFSHNTRVLGGVLGSILGSVTGNKARDLTALNGPVPVSVH